MKSIDPGTLAFWHSGGDVIRVDPHRAAVPMGLQEVRSLLDLYASTLRLAMAADDQETLRLCEREGMQLVVAINAMDDWLSCASVTHAPSPP